MSLPISAQCSACGRELPLTKDRFGCRACFEQMRGDEPTLCLRCLDAHNLAVHRVETKDGVPVKSIDELIAASSLGTPEAVAIREAAPQAAVDAIMRRVESVAFVGQVRRWKVGRQTPFEIVSINPERELPVWFRCQGDPDTIEPYRATREAITDGSVLLDKPYSWTAKLPRRFFERGN